MKQYILERVRLLIAAIFVILLIETAFMFKNTVDPVRPPDEWFRRPGNIWIEFWDQIQ